MFATVGPIAIYLPPTVETNDELRAQFPHWDMDLIYSKTGIRQRHIADPGECASDLGVAAAEKLFRDYAIDRSSIDFLLFCTQTPDYPLPTTACLMQDRLGLSIHVGALDFNLGCSGYVYGLSLAEGLIRSGVARRVLFITAETYSKYIDAADRSLRTIFGDGAAATLIEAGPRAVAFRFHLRHRRPRRRHAHGHQRGMAAAGAGPAAPQAATLAQPAVYGWPGPGEPSPRKASRCWSTKCSSGPACGGSRSTCT